jgi:hypothetical protein
MESLECPVRSASGQTTLLPLIKFQNLVVRQIYAELRKGTMRSNAVKYLMDTFPFVHSITVIWYQPSLLLPANIINLLSRKSSVKTWRLLLLLILLN